MRLPSFTPPARSTKLTLGELREALRIARNSPMEWVDETTTRADALELEICRREIEAGLRAGVPA